MKLMNKLIFASLLALSASVGYAAQADINQQDQTRKVIVDITEANYPRLGTLQPQLRTAAFYAGALRHDVDLLKRDPVDEKHRTILSKIKEELPSMISELKQLMDDDNIQLNAAQKEHLQQAITYAEPFLANQ